MYIIEHFNKKVPKKVNKIYQKKPMPTSTDLLLGHLMNTYYIFYFSMRRLHTAALGTAPHAASRPASPTDRRRSPPSTPARPPTSPAAYPSSARNETPSKRNPPSPRSPINMPITTKANRPHLNMIRKIIRSSPFPRSPLLKAEIPVQYRHRPSIASEDLPDT